MVPYSYSMLHFLLQEKGLFYISGSQTGESILVVKVLTVGKGCVLYIFRVNKSKPDICLVLKAGFVIEDSSNVGST